MTRRVHKLDRYRLAVQHPQAECAFLQRAYAHYFPDRWASRLREDFAGTSAVSAAWVALDDDHRALAVDKHGPTARWAQRFVKRSLGDRAEDVVTVEADVFDLGAPRCDIVAALNFSAFIFHQRSELRRYLTHARRCLDRRGLLVLDAFGGPGAMRVQTQERFIDPPPHEGVEPFRYQWEQRAFDPINQRIDCRIHFVPEVGRPCRNAFRYDWRLWSLPELTELLHEAGFTAAEVWCDTYDPATRRSDGVYRPQRSSPARPDWVAYLIGVKRPAGQAET